MRISGALAGLALVVAASAPARSADAEHAVEPADDMAVRDAQFEELSAGDPGDPHGAAASESAPDDLISATGPFGAAPALATQLLGVDLQLYWERGINYRVEDELTLFEQSAHLNGRIGMRFQGDVAGFAPSGVTDAGGGVDVRRLFFYTTGEFDILYPILFALDVGFQSGSFFVDDAYFWLTDLPYVGTVKVGQFDAPMSLAQLTGSGTRPFMEIGTPAEAFSPGSKAGIQLANDGYDRRLTWQIGWFADTQAVPVGDASESVSRVVARLTGLPIFDRREGAQRLLHLGISASWVFSNQQRVRYRSRPESFLAPTVVDTGDIEASTANLLGLEAAWVDGPVSFQAEMLGTSVDSTEHGNPTFFGVYAMGSWFLTGESRPFNRASAVFGNVVPKKPLAWDDLQIGAWELAGRVSFTDLSDGAVEGGEVFTLMTGVNWYWSRYGRFLFEYGYSDVFGGGPQRGGLHIFQARLQVNI